MSQIEKKELLELVAEAAGFTVNEWFDLTDSGETGCQDRWGLRIGPTNETWNPLTRDIDAVRLIAKFDLELGIEDRFKELGSCVFCTYPTGQNTCDSILQNIEASGGVEQAARMAAVRAIIEMRSEK